MKFYNDYARVENTVSSAAKEKRIKVNRVLPITHPALVAYLHSRGITADTANRFCRELHYHTGDNPSEFFALGFKNVEGGYELRSPIFKAATGKTISLIKDVQQKTSMPNNNKRQIFIFEGFFDMMSLFERRKYMFNGNNEIIPTDFLVLNSTSQINKAKTHIDGYTSVYTFMDNDKSGNSATNAIKEYCKEKKIDCFPMNAEYKQFEDYNKFHVATKQIKQKQIINKI
jgi:5S rRNA maturation endonuclease (ribonuclease M5)